MNFYKPEMLVKSHLLQAIYFVKLVHINSLHICKATRTSFIFEFILIIILISIDTLLYLLHFLQWFLLLYRSFSGFRHIFGSVKEL